MPEDVADAEFVEPDDVCVEDLADLPRASGPPAAALLGLLAESIALVAMGLWTLVIG